METPTSAPFAALLKRYRLAAGLSQEELASRAGLSSRGISDLERGIRVNPRPATVRLLADALGLSATDRATFLAAAQGSALQPPTPAPVEPPSSSDVPSAPTQTAPPRLPTGTITFLFTDIEGSTHLLQRLGAAAFAAARDQHHRLLREVFAAHGGVEVDTQGDAFFVAFPAAPDAVSAAAEVTAALAHATWPKGMALRVRMGLHTGTPLVAGDHYVGLDVVRAARIAAVGHGGQTLLSEATRVLVEGALPDGVLLWDLGAYRLKDLQQPEQLYQLALLGLPAEFPPLKTLEARLHNLPVQATPLIGRDKEVARLCALLRRSDVRLVTLTGPGGVGKTRLGLQLAAEMIDAFADGVYFVRLSRLSDPDLVIPTIAQVFALSERGDVLLVDVLQRYLQGKRLLLVLDNFEHLVAAASHVSVLLATCSGVKVVATSRVPLRLRGEHEFALQPLALPDPAHLPPPERLAQSAAVALFLERAQAAQADFALTAATAPAVAEICARLDGLPLAIELAAAKIKLLPPPSLVKRLTRALPVLVRGARDVDERQQTMHNTLAWSFDLLTPEEQRLFCRLAVFAGGCTLEAAEAVCVTPAGAEPLQIDLVEGLNQLVDHSLVLLRTAPEEEGEVGEPRFAMLHVIREFATEQLEASGEAETLQREHADYFLDLATQFHGTIDNSLPEWMTLLDREHDNLRASLVWAIDHDAAVRAQRAGGALSWFWNVRGFLQEGYRWLHAVLRLTQPPDLVPTPISEEIREALLAYIEAITGLGEIAVSLTRYGDARDALEKAVVLCRIVGDPVRTARAVNDLGLAYRAIGLLDRASACFEETLALARRASELRGTAAAPVYLGHVGIERRARKVAVSNLGWMALLRGDVDAASASFQEAYALALDAGDRVGVVEGLESQGEVALLRHDIEQADALAREALLLARTLRSLGMMLDAVEQVGRVAAAGGESQRAVRLLAAARALRDTYSLPWHDVDLQQEQVVLTAARVALGADAWQAVYNAGRALTLEEAIAEALVEDGRADVSAAEQ
jgi:predicted ATPase/class 3 adenylate cyclase